MASSITHIVQHEPEQGKEIQSVKHGGEHNEYDLREWSHRSRQSCEQRRRTDRAERVVHLPREQRECCRECRAHRRVASERERCERPVRDDDVREGRREYKVGARAKRD